MDTIDRYTGAAHQSVVVGGAPTVTDNAERDVIHSVSEATFHAAVAKMELARCQMKGRAYDGPLLFMSGQPRTVGVCYLLTSREIAIKNALADLTTDQLTIDACCLYPSALYDTVKQIAANRGSDAPPLPPRINTADMGTFAKIGEDKWGSLHAIADDLLEVSKVCSDIEAYQLRIVSHITKMMAAT